MGELTEFRNERMSAIVDDAVCTFQDGVRITDYGLRITASKTGDVQLLSGQIRYLICKELEGRTAHKSRNGRSMLGRMALNRLTDKTDSWT